MNSEAEVAKSRHYDMLSVSNPNGEVAGMDASVFYGVWPVRIDERKVASQSIGNPTGTLVASDVQAFSRLLHHWTLHPIPTTSYWL